MWCTLQPIPISSLTPCLPQSQVGGLDANSSPHLSPLPACLSLLISRPLHQRGGDTDPLQPGEGKLS